MNPPPPSVSQHSPSWLLQYWYKLSNQSFMLLGRHDVIRPEDGPAYLFSTSFRASVLQTDFSSRFSLVPWMTYRQWTGESIQGYYTDCGWGCMLRSAQMMLAEALFRLESPNGSSTAPPQLRERILRQFVDDNESPYSIHQMLKRSNRFGKHAGQWFEPTLTLLVIAEMLQERGIRAIVARDGMLDASSLLPNAFAKSVGEGDEEEEEEEDKYFDPLNEEMVSSRQSTSRPVLLFVPVRLGVRELNEAMYGKALALALRFPQSIGIIGGKPGRSLYFCGSQNNSKLVYLDPHTVQNTLPFSLHSYQCHEAKVMPISEVDPSMALGFLVHSYQDFLELEARILALPGPAMFSISTKPAEFESDEDLDDFAYEDNDDDGGEGEEEGFEHVPPPPTPPPKKKPDDFVLL
ncbi:hypothetical protein BASA81_002486 [Batrachochytrium salamandrivorans]|nr:hypothetical protein BASA81_002486 [Batrachochytrium salamandrivorans]